MQITLEEVYNIVNSNDGNQNVKIATFSEINSTSYSHTASWKLYHIALSNYNRSYLLLVSQLAPTNLHGPLTLPALMILLSKILDNTTVPVPRPVAHSVSGDEGRGYDWLLLRIPPSSSYTHPSLPPSLASIRHDLSPTQLARIELRLGTYIRALHGITNDWFGIPMDKPAPEPLSVPSFTALFAASQTTEDDEENGEDMTPYSWQDTFVLRLEELLEQLYGNADLHKNSSSSHLVDIDVGQLRYSLTRAIGSFLFDDVEMPRLVWMTGNEEDVIVSFSPGNLEQDTEADIAYILPTFGRAIWGDPLMEAWFLPPGPTKAVRDGYFAGDDDGTLIVFPRQNTKRVWYTVYLALVVLAEETSRRDGGETEVQTPGREATVGWARNILPECVEILKNAPCY